MRFLHSKHPARMAVETLLLVAIVAAIPALVFKDLTTVKATDWCAAANFRTCTVTERGEWMFVTTPDGQHMIYVQGGKVVKVQ